MSKAFNIVENEDKDIKKSKYPDLPFVVKDENNDKFLVFYDPGTYEYRYVSLKDGETVSKPYLNATFESLEEMFKANDKDVILETELVIKGLYK